MLRGGTITFLFTDLEGSTRLLHETGEAYGPLLETHRRMIRDAVSAHGGTEFGTGGDAVFNAFDTASAAVSAARDAQRTLTAHAWPPGIALRVRMAVHTGEAQVVDGDYVGMALHVVARLCAAGHGGQVLLSAATRSLSPEAQVLGLGHHRLRDVPEALEIFQLCGDGLDQQFPSLRTADAPVTNLPVSRVELIGRDVDVGEVTEAIENHRLVSLIGPGGSGKSSLAVEIGATLLPRFSDGVWLVQLAAATTADQVLAFVAEQLGIRERGDNGLDTTLYERLAPRELLILLDNCEHLIDAAARLVVGLLEHCPKVRVLTTSRERLGVRGEQAMRVAPLSVGDAGHPGAAVALFIERARAVVPGFDTTAEEMTLITEVCRRLDGLPLAIELATARLQSISLPQLVSRLDDRFRLLTGGARTDSDRQRTLEAVVAWSYDLLTPIEQRFFRRLSVFAGSFPLDATENVADDQGADVFEMLGALVEKSLVLPLRVRSDYRYQMLETLREFGRSRLTAAGELEEANALLLKWVLTLTDRLEEDMRTARQDASLAAVLPERANVQVALDWALKLHNDVDALRIASAFPLLGTSERRLLLIDLLERSPDVSDALRAEALVTLGNLSMEQGYWDDSAGYTEEAAQIFDRLGDARHGAWARYFEVLALWGRPDGHGRADELVTSMVDTFRDLHDDFGLAHALWVSSQFTGDTAQAEASALQSEQLFRKLGANVGLAHALEGRALIALRSEPASDPVVALVEALSIFVDEEIPGCTAHCLEAVAAALASRGELESAAVMLGGAEALRDEVGQEHRPWEREARRRTELALAQRVANGRIDEERRRGQQLSLVDCVQLAQQLLRTDGPTS